jgi:hypothetical protein
MLRVAARGAVEADSALDEATRCTNGPIDQTRTGCGSFWQLAAERIAKQSAARSRQEMCVNFCCNRIVSFFAETLIDFGLIFASILRPVYLS